MTGTSGEHGRTPNDAWRGLLAGLRAESDWASAALLPVAMAAAVHPRLSKLTPFQSMGSLCFSRTGWPYTNDCPRIDVRPTADGWMVCGPPNEAGEPVTILLDTDQLPAAIACAAANLPPEAANG
jgi:hypothetical protein